MAENMMPGGVPLGKLPISPHNQPGPQIGNPNQPGNPVPAVVLTHSKNILGNQKYIFLYLVKEHTGHTVVLRFQKMVNFQCMQ